MNIFHIAKTILVPESNLHLEIAVTKKTDILTFHNTKRFFQYYLSISAEGALQEL